MPGKMNEKCRARKQLRGVPMKRTDGYLRGISILLFAVLGAIAVLWAGVSLSGWPAPDLLGKERCEKRIRDYMETL